MRVARPLGWRYHPTMCKLGLVTITALFAACGGGPSPSPPAADGGASSDTVVMFDTAADLTSPDHFYDFPYPSDSRLSPDGTPNLVGVANPTQSAILEGLRNIAQQRKGFPLTPVAYFQFTAAMPAQDLTKTLDATAPILLLDVDTSSTTLGAALPAIASTPDADRYLPANVLAVAPRPGIILSPHHQYAFVVRRGLLDAAGRPLGVAAGVAALASLSSKDAALAALYAPLWPALAAAKIPNGDVAAAAVFTTGDVVADLADLSTKAVAAYPVDISNLSLDKPDGATHEGFCELHAVINYPQFQGGKPPYDTDGLIRVDGNGVPIKTRDEMAPITFTIPKQPMPTGGYPVIVYFHGTGGGSDAIVDRGLWRPETDTTNCPKGQALDTWNNVTGCNTPGQGPGFVVAPHDIAMVASALPVNPQRYPAGANQAFPEYFNINNVAATRDIFHQGVIEQRLMIDALSRLTIPPSALAACTGASLPAGETAFHFKTDPVLAQGQSMGAMYANMVSATEPRIKAVVATGTGGYWSYFILQTSFIANASGEIGLLLGLHGTYTHMHPAMSLAQTALEPSDPIVFMPRVGHDPLPNHPVRPVYNPFGQGDSYFPMTVQDAAVLSYWHQEAGSQVWPTMQDALTLEGLQGLLPYPVANDRVSLSGAKYTSVAVQYVGDGVYDPHAIYTQLDAVKYQYACFFDSFLATGIATVPAPAPLATPCPH